MAEIDAQAIAEWNKRRSGIFYPKSDLHFKPQELFEKRKQASSLCEDPDFWKIIRRFYAVEPKTAGIDILSLGTFHTIFRVSATPRSAIFKLALFESAYEFGLENWAMQVLRACGLPALEIRAFETSSGGDLGLPYLLEDGAEGESVRDLEDPESQALPEPILFELGRTLAGIHQIKAQGGGFLRWPVENVAEGLHATWSDYIWVRLTEHVALCREIGAIASDESSDILKRFEAANGLLASAPICLLHGDLGHHNVFFDGKKITAIIDWEDALAGDPVFDMAYWGTFVRDEMRARFLEGYQTMSKLPVDFERRYWLYYLRVALSKTVHRHHFGAKDRPGRPPASRRIQKALSKLAEL